MDIPIPGTDQAMHVKAGETSLIAEFGEGDIPLYKVGDGHFVIEDHNEHVYFEDGADGGKKIIVADLMLMEARGLSEAGRTEEALVLYETGRRYFPEDPRMYRSAAMARPCCLETG